MGVMKDRIQNGANLLESHVFQFDFLNDSFDSDKIPDSLKKIINDKNKRKKLLIYINPPYAEAGNKRTVTGTGSNRDGVAIHKIAMKYESKLGFAKKELFSQFLLRVALELPNCILAQFSTLKTLQAPAWKKFREAYTPDLKKVFLVPANTFDNVSGSFPIGFFIWDTSVKRTNSKFKADVYTKNGEFSCSKFIYCEDDTKAITEWHRKFYEKNVKNIAFLRMIGPDIQNNTGVFITTTPSANDFDKCHITGIVPSNVHQVVVYLSVRKVIRPTWVNNRDLYLYPKAGLSNQTPPPAAW